ncbi:hypothetical protein ALC60_05981 [Trachymyrmex zeteki]|uniref:Uncharacterized protein n=1 Tax=Mycetomoellerius zeteki TaxID=64791 RepID=A0A151X4C4_9HYME|nr:hypothetical protein ALC60_05981 [Trachymyrmex zeteki]
MTDRAEKSTTIQQTRDGSERGRERGRAGGRGGGFPACPSPSPTNPFRPVPSRLGAVSCLSLSHTVWVGSSVMAASRSIFSLDTHRGLREPANLLDS